MHSNIFISLIFLLISLFPALMADSSKEFQKELAEVAPAPRLDGPVEDLTAFNVEYGFLEAFLRGTFQVHLTFLLLPVLPFPGSPRHPPRSHARPCPYSPSCSVQAFAPVSSLRLSTSS